MELIIATRNKGKLAEFGRILKPLGIEVKGQEELCPDLEVEETGSTFAENARLKAQAIYEATGMTAVADDSGLCVDALDGAPGVYSARYAGENATDVERIEKLLGEIQDVPALRRTARFVSAICCVGEDLLIECEGICEGVIGHAPTGEGGFGYDPIFFVGEKSFAEMSAEEKDAVSHRGQALRMFYESLKGRV